MIKRIVLGVVTVMVVLGMASCSRKSNSVKVKRPPVLRVAMSEMPGVLDPRKVRDLNSATVMRMLFEGLTRLGTDGKPEPALAEVVSVSEDRTTYTFKLRKALWSDGSPVTAEDFASSWRRVLDPNFPAPNAFQFYVIRGARDAKEGRRPVEDIGVEVVDRRTLVVRLEEPYSQFLELTSFHAFFPVNKMWEEAHPAWAHGDVDQFVGNGPFALEALGGDQMTVVKNTRYWGTERIDLDRIELVVQDENTALLLYEEGQLDWVGSPLSRLPSDAIPVLRAGGSLQIADAAGTQFFRFNTETPPLTSMPIRKALSFAINRNALTDHLLMGGQKPALSLVPPIMGMVGPTFFGDDSGDTARQLLVAGLDELGMTLEEMPTLVMTYSNDQRHHRIAQAVQQQWKHVLGIDIELRQMEGKLVLESIRQGDYQIAISSWFADVNDPSNFLEVFKRRDNGTNNTRWESEAFASAVDAARMELNPERRSLYFRQAEARLIDAMPIAPIYYFTYPHLHRRYVQGVYLSPLGFLDFRNARIDTNAE